MLYYLLIGFVTFLTLFIGILFVNIKIDLGMMRKGENDEINIRISALKELIKYETTIPFVDFFDGGRSIIRARIYKKAKIARTEASLSGEEGQNEGLNFDEIKAGIDLIKYFYRRYWKVYQYINRKIIIHQIQWCTEIGLEDAAVTAIASGFLWAIKSNIIVFLKTGFTLKDIQINVIPCYASEKLTTTFHCIVTLKIGYIINAGIKMLLIKLKGGGKFERASN
ncbi:DUF2953 domain-containing protein [Natronincola ferrireducens]|uniref:DUF2953 domain-containing protein n=1 Tax=Natronincola ferrireducens TaxID=393762 RepID=A0A1G9CDY9_9FIRM|nr:DUF2953 domain-containing protein [Natronincola ferrireducens]SDK49852.1 Protein of unknown function [Natronincola ferrireducens]